MKKLFFITISIILVCFLIFYFIEYNPFSKQENEYLKNKNFKNCIVLVSTSYEYKNYKKAILYANECLDYPVQTKAWLYMVIAESYFYLDDIKNATVFAKKADADNKKYDVLGNDGVNVLEKIKQGKGK